MVPANRHGFNTGFNGFQLKMIEEIITLVLFAVLYLKEPLHWRYAVSFMLLVGAAWFMFSQKPI